MVPCYDVLFSLWQCLHCFYEFLRSFSPEERTERISKLFSHGEIPCIILSRDLPALKELEEKAKECGHEVVTFQSNYEGGIIDRLQEAYFDRTDGIVINPAAYTHTSVAILDALKSVGIPTVEVHISDVSKREDFRQVSYVRQACIKTITGLGFDGYLRAIDKLIKNGK